MKKSRLNDTAALQVAPAVPKTENESRGVSINRIDNGYIVREYSDGPDGYKSSEKFSETKPTIDNMKSGGEMKSSSLKDAIDHCK